MSKYNSKNGYGGNSVHSELYYDLLMLKALLPSIIKLLANLSVLHLGIKSLLLPPRREYSVSWFGGTRECNLYIISIEYAHARKSLTDHLSPYKQRQTICEDCS